MPESNLKTISWNDASALGLIERINREVLHPLGLAMFRDPDTGVSDGLLVADDGVWEYAPEMQAAPVLTPEQVRAQVAAIVKAQPAEKP